MAIKEESLIIDLDKENYIPSFQVKQNDDVILKIKLTKDNKLYNFLGNTVNLYARKPTGTFIEQNKNISNNNTEIIIKCKNSAFDTPGICIGELELKDSKGLITTANFYYIVVQKAVNFKDIKSIIDVDSIKDLEEYISAFKLSLETFKNNLKDLTNLNSTKDKLEIENNNAKENIKNLSSINVKALENINNLTNLKIPELESNINIFKKNLEEFKKAYNTHYHKNKHPVITEPLTMNINDDVIQFDSNSRKGLYVEKSKNSSTLQGKQPNYFWNKDEQKTEMLTITGSSDYSGANFYCFAHHIGKFTYLHLGCDCIKLSSQETGNLSFSLPFSIKDWHSASFNPYKLWENNKYNYGHWKAGNIGGSVWARDNKVNVVIQGKPEGVAYIGATVAILVERI